MDVLIFMVQSNMQGSTGEKCDFPLDENLFEYRYLTDEITPLSSPVGETIGGDLLAAAALGNGSLVQGVRRKAQKENRGDPRGKGRDEYRRMAKRRRAF